MTFMFDLVPPRELQQAKIRHYFHYPDFFLVSKENDIQKYLLNHQKDAIMFVVICVNCTLRNANFQNIGYLSSVISKKSLSLIKQAVFL